MKRNKRSLHQLQQTVKMKIAVIQQQKEDLMDILNDFTSSMLTEVEQEMTKGDGSHAQYQATLAQLDKVSQIFTNLSSHIDSTLYPDEDKIIENPKVDASCVCEAVSPIESDKSQIETEQKNPFIEGSEIVKELQEVLDVKLVDRLADTKQRQQEATKEKNPEILEAVTDTPVFEATSEQETQSYSVTHQPSSRSEEDAMKQKREAYIGPPLFLPSVPGTLQPTLPPLVQQDVLIEPDKGGNPGSFALSAPQAWAQPTSHHIELNNFPIHRTVPFVNTLNPRFGATGLNFQANSFSEGTNLFLGQNLYQQLPLLNAGQAVIPHSSNLYSSFNNPANLAHLTSWPRANYLSQLNSLSAGPFLPARHGVLVQSPLITPAPPSSEINAQVAEFYRSRSRCSSVDTSVRANSTSPLTNYDQEVAALLQCKSGCQGELGPCRQTNKDKTPSPSSSHEACSIYSLESMRIAAPKEERQGNIAENPSGCHMHDEDSRANSQAGSPPALDKSSVSCTFGPKLRTNISQPFHSSKSRKIKDIPDDLKDIIKQAMQENKIKEALQETEKMLDRGSNTFSTSNPEIPKDISGEAKDHSITPILSKKQKQPENAEGPQYAQLQLKKDQIVVVAISNIEDPWAFHAQLPTFLPHISQTIQEAVESRELSNVAPQSGLFCLAKFTNGKYYRAKVEQHIDMGDYPPRLQVSYVDYGNKHWVSASDLLQLPKSLTKLPAQSVFCTLAKVIPASDNWTEKATELLRQVSSNGNVQMRIIHPKSKKRRNFSGSPGTSPLSPDAEPIQYSQSPNSSSFFEIPYLVDIIARQAMGTEAVSVSSVLVKAGLAKFVSTESQLDTLVEINAQSIDRRFLGLQQMMNNLKAANTTHKNLAVDDTSIPVVTQGSSAKPRHRRIPSCLQTTKLKGTYSKSFFSKPTRGESLNRLNNLTSKDISIDHTNLAEQTNDPEVLKSFNESSLTLCVEVDKNLRNLDQAKENNKKSENNESSKTSNKCKPDLDCGKKGEEGDEVEYEVVLTSVISPSSFFVQPVNGHSDMAWLVEGLNKKYGSLTNQILIIMSDAFTLEQYTICCAMFSEDACYYRGRILDTKPDQVLILFIDFGDFEWVPRNKVFPLSDEFKRLPALALWCSLKGVMPPCVNEPQSKGHRWSMQAIKTFKSLVMDCTLLKIVVSNSDQQKFEGQILQCEPLEVFLIDQSETSKGSLETESGTDQLRDELCLNYELIHLGLAVVQPSFIIHLANEEDLEPELDLTNWDPLGEDFESHRNSYKVNIDDPGVALLGYEARKPGTGGRKVCVFYKRGNGCFKGDTCPDLHVKTLPDGSGLQHDLGPVRVYDEDQSSLLPREGALVIVTVSTVVTPTKFYVTLPWGRLTFEEVASHSDAWHRFQAEENLEGLMENMQKFYAQRHYDRDLTVLGFCEAIAARVEGRWIRAKVIDSNEDKGLVQVVSVDFGWEVWVKEKELRDLELRFLHLPPQAVTCSLAMVAPSAQNGHTWVSDTCKCFADLVMDRSLVALVHRRDPSGRLSLVLYDTSGSGDLNINQAMVDRGWARTLSKGQTSWFPHRGTVVLSPECTMNISMAPA